MKIILNRNVCGAAIAKKPKNPTKKKRKYKILKIALDSTAIK
jgi:hypothetical protein